MVSSPIRRRAAGAVVLLVVGAIPVGPFGTAGRADASFDAATRSLAELRDVAGTSLVVGRDGAAVTFVGGAHALTPPDDRDPADVAGDFADDHGDLYAGGDAAGTLVEDSVTDLPAGDQDDATTDGAAVRYQQRIDGLPVLGGELVVRVDDAGRVRSAAGELAPADAAAGLDTTATLTASQAIDLAVAVTARDAEVDAASLHASAAELTVYDPSLIGASGLPGARLVWHVDVRTDAGDVDRFVLVDADTGAIVLAFGQVHAADAQVCDNAQTVRSSNAQAACPSPLTVVRSDATGASGVSDVERAYQLSKAVVSFYGALGRNSIDGNGMTVLSTVRFCITGSSCPYQNAFWNGTQMMYGTGYASADDVVGHELTHGVTQYESKLLYYAESGAINESLSDVFGELFDQWYDSSWDDDTPGAAWLIGEDLPIGAIRSMSNPPAYGDPDRMTSPNYWGSSSDEYGVHTNSGVNNKAAFLMADGGTFNGRTVGALGIMKTAYVYLEAQTSLLTAGSDYLDLSHALPQACTNLVGQHGITSGDCTQVQLAVDATEMALAPTVAGARLTAPDCPTGQVRQTTLFGDDMETATGWTSSSTSGAPGTWGYTSQTSQSGTRALFGPDPSVLSQGSVTMPTSVSITSADTYLRFDHSFSFDSGSGTWWDGGLVRYRIGAGAYQRLDSLAGVATVNGPNGALTGSGSGNDNAFAGQSMFVGDSPGYQETRYRLGSLAGSTVQFQWLVTTDSSFAGTGWALDDVEIYTCVAASPTTVASSTTAPTTTAPATTVTTAAPVTTAAATTTSSPAVSGSGFEAVAPARVFDTRPGESPAALVSVPKQPVEPSAPLTVRMVDLAGATPATGVGAVSLNVTVTEPGASGYLTVFPCGNRSLVSSVNFTAGATVANAVVAPVSADGTVCFAPSTPLHLVVDLTGWLPAGGSFHAVDPARVLDTRGESPGALLETVGRLSPTAPLEVPVADLPGGITPASGIAAISLNVTVTDPASAGYVTVYPCGARPPVSSVNFRRSQTVANAVIAPVSADGRICVAASASTHLVVDVNGWFAAAGAFQPAGPERIFDTRPGQSPDARRTVVAGPVTPSAPVRVRISDIVGLTPADGIGAVSLNVTVTEPARAGFVTVHPCGDRPQVSSVNFAAGDTVANAVVAQLSPDGELCFFSSTSAHLVVDLNGWFPG
ncbi:MAG: M4 family metallopeptidase [Acidimicrobiales bacterium]